MNYYTHHILFVNKKVAQYTQDKMQYSLAQVNYIDDPIMSHVHCASLFYFMTSYFHNIYIPLL